MTIKKITRKTPEEIAREIICGRNTAIVPANKDFLIQEIAEAIALDREESSGNPRED